MKSNAQPTLKDIALEAGVSVMTASSVLNASRSSTRVSEATTLRVKEIAGRLGYRPNLNARALVTGRTKIIALYLYRMDAPFAMAVARQMQAIAWEDGYEIVVHEFTGDDAHLRSMVDGILQLDRVYLETDTPCSQEQTPHVAFGAYCNDLIDSVGVDLKTASLEAMQVLLNAGRKRIAFLGRRDPFVRQIDDRLSAYLQAMETINLAPEVIDTPVNTRTAGWEATLMHALSGSFPDAIFCLNDELAMGCYRALNERGMRIPEDVAVIGCDGMDEGKFLSPPLTTISQPIESLCRRAWEFLKLRMTNREGERQQMTLPASLTLRESH
jgi:DNA-binding LacI/PurR family transcriptional regulator